MIHALSAGSHPPAPKRYRKIIDTGISKLRNGGCHLSNDSCHSSTHHAPAEQENENGVKDDVDDRARQRGDHGKFRVSICPDNGVHGLTKHIKGDSRGDVEEILPGMMKDLGIDGAAEHGNDGIRENQVNCGEHQSADHRHDHGVAHAASGGFGILFSQADADEGAAAVTDHYRDSQCHDGQGEYHGIGGVAVGAKVAGIGDKNLVNDVIKRAHQKGDDAGDGVLLHKPADTLRPQMLIGLFHWYHVPLHNIKIACSPVPDLRHRLHA